VAMTWNALSSVPWAACSLGISSDRARQSIDRSIKLVQLTFYKNRQNIWRDGNAYRFGVITGSRRLQP
jgi:hypothetical protein